MIKGKTTLRFKDKETGKTLRVYKKENMVTNAYRNIIEPNFVSSANGGGIGNIASTYTPLRGLFGGVLLFDNEVDTNTIIPTKNEFSHFIGCAGGDYSGDSVVRGYLDASQCEFKNDYIKEVFVFGLDKCNHEIKTIGLSSVAGGACGLSKLDDTDTSFFSGYATSRVLNQSSTCNVGYGQCNFVIPYVVVEEDGNLIGTDKDGNLVCVKHNGNNNITIKKFKYKGKLGFIDTIREFDGIGDYPTTFESLSSNGLYEMVMDLNITIPCEIVANSKDLTILDNYIYSCKSLENGAFIVAKIDISESNTKIYYGTIETDITSVEECKTIGNEIYATNDTNLYVIKLPELTTGGSTHSCIYNRIVMLENNMIPIPFKDTVLLLSKNPCEANTSQNIYFLTNNNSLLLQKIKYGNSTSGQAFRSICFNLSEPLVGLVCEGIVDGREVDTISVNVVNPYLSTINVLTTAQYKPATEQLEITYELTMT